MADVRITFDADTGEYVAKIVQAHQHTKGFFDEYAHGLPFVAQLGTAVGAAEVATEGLKKVWEEWHRAVEDADKTVKQIVDRLEGVAATAGLGSKIGEIRKAIEESNGPLNAEQKVGAVAAYKEASPQGITVESTKLALEQAQMAARAFGPENVNAFMGALGQAMEAGVGQKEAGDIASAALQSGDKGTSALAKVVDKFVQEYPDFAERQGADFKSYLLQADPGDFGRKSAAGGLALQANVSRGASLDKAVGDTESDPRTRAANQRRTLVATTEAENERLRGERAETIEERKATADAMMVDAPSVLRVFGNMTVWLQNNFESTKLLKERLEADRATLNKNGLPRFIAEAHDEKGE